MLRIERSVAEGIRVLVLDVDGVLTTSHLILGKDGEEIKFFSVKDGVAIKFAQHAGIEVAFLSARSSTIVERRAEMLGVTRVYQGEHAKLERVRRIASECGVDLENIAYVGDDIVDMEPLDAVGFGVAVADACVDVLERARHVADAQGGCGAVRETIEAILKARGDWDVVVADYIAKA
ncbi:HAD hydrolase family protein [bacterium]|nr:HAD hydrolase family protein [bacterium]